MLRVHTHFFIKSFPAMFYRGIEASPESRLRAGRNRENAIMLTPCEWIDCTTGGKKRRLGPPDRSERQNSDTESRGRRTFIHPAIRSAGTGAHFHWHKTCDECCSG